MMDVLNAVLDVIMNITMFVIKFTPLGIFSISVKVIAQQILMECVAVIFI